MKTSIMRSLSTLVAAATSASLGAWITVGLLSSSLQAAAGQMLPANEVDKETLTNAKGDVIAVGNAGLSLVLGGKPSPAEKRAGAPAGTVKSRTFNVLNYGAVGDDKTDNTEAFSACLKAVIAAGGGKMFIPDGIYRGRIIIPGTKEWITVEIVGESEPTPVWGTIGAFPFPKNGTIIQCLAESGPAVISAANVPEKLWNRFSGVNVSLRNLDVRTYNNPGIGGIDLLNAVQCKIENVFVNTDIYSVQASKPTHGTAGISTPACNNGALTILRNVMVTGYHTGILVNEHTDGDNINLGSNINGLEFLSNHHASRFGRVCAQRNTHHITVSGRHGFSIEQMNTEQPGKGQTDANNAWQALVSDVNDPKNLGSGDINYWVVEGNVGAVETFTRNGGAGIRARRIGSSEQSEKSPQHTSRDGSKNEK